MRAAPAWIVLAAAGAAAGQAPAASPPPPTPRHELFVSAAGQDLQPGGSGSALSLGWIHHPSDRLSAEVAFHTERLDGTRWTFARVSGVAWPSRRLLLRLDARLGHSEVRGRGDPYRQLGAALGGVLVPGRLHLELESLYVDAGALRGHVARPGLTLYITPRISVASAFYRSTGSGLDVSAIHLRLDLHRDSWSPFAGAVLGRIAAPLGPAPRFGEPTTSHVYSGLRVPLGRHRLVVAGERSRTEEQTWLRLSVLWRMGL